MRTYIVIKKCRVRDLEDGDVVLLRGLGEEYAYWRPWGDVEQDTRDEWGDLDLVDVQVAE